MMDKAHSKVEVQVDDKRLDFSISISSAFYLIHIGRDIVYSHSFIISPFRVDLISFFPLGYFSLCRTEVMLNLQVDELEFWSKA